MLRAKEAFPIGTWIKYVNTQNDKYVLRLNEDLILFIAYYEKEIRDAWVHRIDRTTVPFQSFTVLKNAPTIDMQKIVSMLQQRYETFLQENQKMLQQKDDMETMLNALKK